MQPCALRIGVSYSWLFSVPSSLLVQTCHFRQGRSAVCVLAHSSGALTSFQQSKFRPGLPGGILTVKFQTFGLFKSGLAWENTVWHVRHRFSCFWPFLVVNEKTRCLVFFKNLIPPFSLNVKKIFSLFVIYWCYLPCFDQRYTYLVHLNQGRWIVFLWVLCNYILW